MGRQALPAYPNWDQRKCWSIFPEINPSNEGFFSCKTGPNVLYFSRTMGQEDTLTHDKNGIEWARLSRLKAGDLVLLDSGFTCAKAGEIRIYETSLGLFFPCQDGAHYLSAQSTDGDHLMGIYEIEDTK